MQSTEQLVESARTGDVAAIAELVERYEHTAVLTALTVLGDFHLAEDVAQESFVEAFKNLKHLRSAQSFGPWLLTNVRRRAGRARRRLPNESRGLELGELVPNRECWSERFQELLPLLSRLPDQEFLAVSLRYISGMSVKEIAIDTGHSVGTVTKQLSRAIQRLKTIVAEVE